MGRDPTVLSWDSALVNYPTLATINVTLQAASGTYVAPRALVVRGGVRPGRWVWQRKTSPFRGLWAVRGPLARVSSPHVAALLGESRATAVRTSVSPTFRLRTVSVTSQAGLNAINSNIQANNGKVGRRR